MPVISYLLVESFKYGKSLQVIYNVCLWYVYVVFVGKYEFVNGMCLMLFLLLILVLG